MIRRTTRAAFAAASARALDRALIGAWLGILVLLVLAGRQVLLDGDDLWLGFSLIAAAVAIILLPVLAGRAKQP